MSAAANAAMKLVAFGCKRRTAESDDISATAADCEIESEVEPVQVRPQRAGALNIIANILDRPVIEKILTHLTLDPQPPPRGRAREALQDFAARAAPARPSQTPRPRRNAKAPPGRRRATLERGTIGIRVNPGA